MFRVSLTTLDSAIQMFLSVLSLKTVMTVVVEVIMKIVLMMFCNRYLSLTFRDDRYDEDD